jgi:hypothetical protein
MTVFGKRLSVICFDRDGMKRLSVICFNRDGREGRKRNISDEIQAPVGLLQHGLHAAPNQFCRPSMVDSSATGPCDIVAKK